MAIRQRRGDNASKENSSRPISRQNGLNASYERYDGSREDKYYDDEDQDNRKVISRYDQDNDFGDEYEENEIADYRDEQFRKQGNRGENYSNVNQYYDEEYDEAGSEEENYDEEGTEGYTRGDEGRSGSQPGERRTRRGFGGMNRERMSDNSGRSDQFTGRDRNEDYRGWDDEGGSRAGRSGYSSDYENRGTARSSQSGRSSQSRTTRSGRSNVSSRSASGSSGRSSDRGSSRDGSQNRSGDVTRSRKYVSGRSGPSRHETTGRSSSTGRSTGNSSTGRKTATRNSSTGTRQNASTGPTSSQGRKSGSGGSSGTARGRSITGNGSKKNTASSPKRKSR